MTICGGCDTTWTGTSPCHCGGSGGCHRTFGSARYFDAHRVQYGDRGSCADPATVTIQTGTHAGEPFMVLRDGMWRGPEMTDEQKLARFGPQDVT